MLVYPSGFHLPIAYLMDPDVTSGGVHLNLAAAAAAATIITAK